MDDRYDHFGRLSDIYEVSRFNSGHIYTLWLLRLAPWSLPKLTKIVIAFKS